MLKLPSYLLLSSYGVYYFRIMVPKALRRHFEGKREVRRSLRTSNRKEAVKRARELMVDITRIFEETRQIAQHEKFDYEKVCYSWEFRKKLVDREAELCRYSLEKVIDAKGPVPTDHLGYIENPERFLAENYGLVSKADRLKTFYERFALRLDLLAEENHADFKDMIREMYDQYLVPNFWNYSRSKTTFGPPAIQHETQSLVVIPQQLPSAQEPETEATLISKVIEEYCDEKKREGSWTEKTENENRAIYDLFVRILGNISIKAISHEQARDYKRVLQQLPPNLNKAPLYKSKTIDQILAMKPKTLMSTTTVNKNLNRISTLFEWIERHGYAQKNYFKGLGLKSTKQAHEERKSFTSGDLRKLFSSEVFTEKKYKHSYYYWLPLIALYSGARIEEICQLHLADIRAESGVWVFDINGDGDVKKLKTASSKRLIPIHSKLLQLGLLIRVQELCQQGKDRLFPELKRQRDGYGQAASRWFNGRYRKSCGVTEEGKTFHSFRHTVSNHLKQKGIEENKTKSLLGHQIESMTYGRYANPYEPAVLKEVVERLDYDLDF